MMKKSRFYMIIILMILLSITGANAAQSFCGSPTLFFQHNLSTSPAGYEELINYPSGNPEEDESVTVINTGGQVLIDSYITPIGSFSTTSSLEAGLRRYRTYHYVDNAVGTTTINFTAFKRSASGVETKYYSVTTDDINDLTPAEYLTSYVSPTAMTFLPTDRYVIKVYGQTTHSSPIKIHFVYQGSIHTSHLESGYFVCPDGGGQSQGSAIQASATPTDPAIPIIAAMVCAAVWFTFRKKE